MRILLVAGRHPFPPRRGDQLRAVQSAGALATRHRVTLLVPEPPAGTPAPLPQPFAIETFARHRAPLPLALLHTLRAGLPLQNAFFAYPALERRVAELGPEADLVMLQTVRMAALLPAIGDARLLVDLIDSLTLNIESRARRDRRSIAPLLGLEARRIDRCERRMVARSGCSLVVSERDRLELQRRLPAALGHRLRTVPIAVDPDPAVGEVQPGGGGGDRRGGGVMVFSGNLGYFPNRDGLIWLLDRVWPRLRRERPELRLVAAGSRAPRGLRRALERAGAELLDAPADLRAVVARATLAVAPLYCGSGMPIKVLEAWAAGVPVVASPWAAAGVDGDGALAVADAPAEWIDTIGALLDAPARRARLAAAGRDRLRGVYSSEAVGRGFSAAVEAAVLEAREPVAAGPGAAAGR